MQIVLAKVENTGLRDTGEFLMRDRNWFPKFEACPEPKACMWLANGKQSDVEKAMWFAAQEGWTVFVYHNERDPIRRAKLEIMEQ